jgi:hypothetical protein
VHFLTNLLQDLVRRRGNRVKCAPGAAGTKAEPKHVTSEPKQVTSKDRKSGLGASATAQDFFRRAGIKPVDIGQAMSGF